MKTKKITMLAIALILGLLRVQGQKVCEDWNGYVDSKNKNATGYINLTVGYEEKAAQTYHFSGPGQIGTVRVYGAISGVVVPLRVSIFNVDSKGRPTSEVKGEDFNWWFYNSNYKEVAFSGGAVSVSSNFAVVVSIRSGTPNGTTFQVKYTGNGEGNGQDLASLAGTATGGNWASAMTTYTKDGDFYLVPKMNNDLTAGFTVGSLCATTSTNIAFTNTSELGKDSMFNTIAWSGYSGSAKYYAWNFGDGGSSNLENPTHTYANAGSYTARLIVTFAGWTNSKSDTFTRKISVGLGVSVASSTNASCYGSNNGSVTASGSGGTTPYQYSLNDNTYQSSATFSNLPAGSHTLYVKDALGCKSSVTFNITQPTALTFSSVGVTDASCNTSNGAILAVGTGGAGSLQYKLDAGSLQSSGSFSGLAAGSYLITVVDANACSNTTNAIVNNSGSPVLIVNSVTNVSCNGGSDGSLTLSSTGGTGAVQYSIDGGTTFKSSGSFPGLSSGSYSVLVKDAAGCSSGKVISITQPSIIDFAVSSSAAACFGSANGEIHFSSAIGGIGKLSYSVNGANYQSSPDFTGLTAGNYTVYVKDYAACIVTKAVSVTQPTKIITSRLITDAVCNGSNTGSILVSASGGTPAYKFSLNSNDYQATGLFDYVGAGNHYIIVQDNNQCLDTVYATVGQPTAVTASVNTTNSTCGNSNGSMLIVGSGGSGSAYNYSLDGTNWLSSGQFLNKAAGTYYIAVRDAVGCITVVTATIMDSNGPTFGTISNTGVSCNGGSDGTITVNSVSGGTGAILYSLDGITWQSSNKFTGLMAGTYVVIVKDANGCRSNSNSVVLTQPNAIVITKTVTNVTCFGTNNGSVTITAVGGAGTLAYSIDGGLTYQSDKTFNNLYAGDYTVIVRDAGKCSNSISFTVIEPSRVNIYLGVLNVSCNGAGNGEITINANGGKLPYTYSLGSGYQTSNTFKGLSGGAYTCFVMDGNSCIVSKSVEVIEPDVLEIVPQVSEISCAGGNNGVIDLTVFGGVKPYTYLWSNNAVTEDVFNLRAGQYGVLVKDANGCEASMLFTLTQPATPIVINGVVINTVGTTGSVDITVTGGVLPYRFSWSNGKQTEDISGLAPGNYIVTVTDANGCVATSQFTVSNASSVSVQDMTKQIKMYPNPASESVAIELSGYKVQEVNIFNNLGQSVYHSGAFTDKVEINTSDLTTGIYHVEIIAEGYKITRKLTISK